MSRYRLDEPICRGRSLKRAIWIEEILGKGNDYAATENYLLIHLRDLLVNKKFTVLSPCENGDLPTKAGT